MNDLDTRLTGALQADAPPARDLLFRVEVLARLERRQFTRRVIRATAVALAAVVLVAVNLEAIKAWMVLDEWHAWIVAFGAAATMFTLPGVQIETEPGARTLLTVAIRWLYP